MNKGYVYLVGAGPGDIGLITVKGLECIQRADVIVYDRLANPRLLSYARPDAKYIYVGKTPDHHTLKQEEINEVLVEEALKGQVVTRLKGGDPYVFGRGGEEGERLREAGSGAGNHFGDRCAVVCGDSGDAPSSDLDVYGHHRP